MTVKERRHLVTVITDVKISSVEEVANLPAHGTEWVVDQESEDRSHRLDSGTPPDLHPPCEGTGPSPHVYLETSKTGVAPESGLPYLGTFSDDNPQSLDRV